MSPLTPLVAELKGNSLDDGPGIRSVVFLKGCPLDCDWCHNPETKRIGVELGFDASACIGARDCLAACPLGALDPSLASFVDRDTCDTCGRCVEVCPSGALRLVGRERPVEDVMAELARYEPFHRASGGGLTLSGGEATLHPQYCGSLLREARARGIHTLLETCGHFVWDRVRTHMLPWLDEVYVDVKLMDPGLHRRHCGTDNRVILDNVAALVAFSGAGGPTVLPRVPLVPGITATDENLTAIASFLRALGVSRVSLLAYNPLWHDKAATVGVVPAFAGEGWMSREDDERCRAHFDGFELVD
jgi:pyruvate formate lyase activating enzyme